MQSFWLDMIGQGDEQVGGDWGVFLLVSPVGAPVFLPFIYRDRQSQGDWVSVKGFECCYFHVTID